MGRLNYFRRLPEVKLAHEPQALGSSASGASKSPFSLGPQYDKTRHDANAVSK